MNAYQFRFTVQTARGLKTRWFKTESEAQEFWAQEARWVKSYSAPNGVVFPEPKP